MNIVDMLQDVSFKNSYFGHIVKYVYLASMTLFSLAGLMFITLAFSHGVGFGLLSLVLAPLTVLLGIAFVRIVIETLLSVMRSSKYIKELARSSRLPTKSDGNVGSTRSSNKPNSIPEHNSHTGSDSDNYRQTGF